MLSVRTRMRLVVLLFTLPVLCSTASAQTTSPAVPSVPPSAAAQPQPDFTLPVSLRAIRRGIARMSRPGLVPVTMDGRPVFRVEVRQRIAIEGVFETLEVPKERVPLFGLTTYEYLRITTPATTYPSVQPWGAFDQSQLPVVAATTIASSLIMAEVAKLAKTMPQKIREKNARATVKRDIALFCASQEDGGTGQPICDAPRTPR